MHCSKQVGVLIEHPVVILYHVAMPLYFPVIAIQCLMVLLHVERCILRTLEQSLHGLMMLHERPVMAHHASMVLYQVCMLLLECLIIRMIKVR